jgi:hypothetical protein
VEYLIPLLGCCDNLPLLGLGVSFGHCLRKLRTKTQRRGVHPFAFPSRTANMWPFPPNGRSFEILILNRGARMRR